MQFQPNNALTQALTIEGFIYGGSKNGNYFLEIDSELPTKTNIVSIRGTTPESILAAAEKHGFTGHVERLVTGTAVTFNNGPLYTRAKELWVGQKTGFVFD